MKITLFWDVMTCSPVKELSSSSGYTLGSVFNTVDGSGIFLQNNDESLPDYMVSDNGQQ
jgi:hypothetical protein